MTKRNIALGKIPEFAQPVSPQAAASAGFTLLEVLVVIGITGLLVGLIAPAALRHLGVLAFQWRNKLLNVWGAVLDMYKLAVGTYPATSDGLAALVDKPPDAANWNGPYLKGNAAALDPWNHHYIYRNLSNAAVMNMIFVPKGQTLTQPMA